MSCRHPASRCDGDPHPSQRNAVIPRLRWLIHASDEAAATSPRREVFFSRNGPGRSASASANHRQILAIHADDAEGTPHVRARNARAVPLEPRLKALGGIRNGRLALAFTATMGDVRQRDNRSQRGHAQAGRQHRQPRTRHLVAHRADNDPHDHQAEALPPQRRGLNRSSGGKRNGRLRHEWNRVKESGPATGTHQMVSRTDMTVVGASAGSRHARRDERNLGCDSATVKTGWARNCGSLSIPPEQSGRSGGRAQSRRLRVAWVRFLLKSGQRGASRFVLPRNFFVPSSPGSRRWLVDAGDSRVARRRSLSVL